MNEEKLQTIQQRKNGKQQVLRKLVANARNIISYKVGVPVDFWKINHLITWLGYDGVPLNFPVFAGYWNSFKE